MTPERPITGSEQPLQILIVEDDGDDRDLLLLYLRRNEFTFAHRFVDCAEEMIQALSDQPWDVVISDHRLPRFSSAEALAMVQRLSTPPPFILVSGSIGETAAVDALLNGVTDFVMKGNLARLGPSIRRALVSVEHARYARAAELALKDSEERFRTLTQIAPVGIYLTNANQECLYVNERWCEITGLSVEQTMGRDWRTVLQVQGGTSGLKATALFAEDPYRQLKFESRVVRSDRKTVWVIGQMLPRLDADEDLIGHVGVITDITERKRAELELVQSEKRLRELSSHLVQIEESQRAAIAREIHDDIGSSLVGMKIDLVWLREATANNVMAQEKLRDFEQLIDAAAAASTRIVRQLRPSILDHGAVAAIEWQLMEFERRFNIESHFEYPANEPELSEDQAVALFRIVQEALNNVAKHAQASQVTVTLFATASELTMEICDNGCGLRAGRAERPGSYGIIGMRERIQSLGGWLEIDSTPGQGVTLMVGIPFRDSRKARQA